MGFISGNRYRKRAYKKVRKYAKSYLKSKSAWAIAKDALRATKYIKGMINCEKKYHDFVTNTTSDYSGFISCLTNMSQGDGDSTRDGNSILGRSILFRASILKESGAYAQDFRIIMFQDKQNIAGTPITMANLLENTGNRNSLISPLDRNINGRIKVIRDWKFTLDSAKATSKRIDEYIKLYLHPKFIGGSSADFDRDHIFIAVLCNNTPGQNLPTIDITTRFGFYDN